MMTSELLALKETIEKETGFVCYEDSSNNQITFFGTSDKLADFKALAADKFKTATIVYCLDTGDSQMYSKYKNAWY